MPTIRQPEINSRLLPIQEAARQEAAAKTFVGLCFSMRTLHHYRKNFRRACVRSHLAAVIQVPVDRLTLLLHREKKPGFIVFAQGRSGSTLLEDLLSSHPKINRAREVLGKLPRRQNLFLWAEAQSRRSAKEIWGFKAKIYQISDNQRTDPARFLQTLRQHGWKIIYLRRRNLVSQGVSNFVRVRRGQPHKKNDADETVHLHIDPDALVEFIRKKEKYLQLEANALAGIPHKCLVYEDHLMNAQDHQKTADELFAWLGVSSVPVRTKLRKITPTGLQDVIENYDEVAQALKQSGHKGMLDAVSRHAPAEVVSR